MSPWYSRNFGDPLLAGDSLDRLAERFRTEYERAGRPPLVDEHQDLIFEWRW